MNTPKIHLPLPRTLLASIEKTHDKLPLRYVALSTDDEPCLAISPQTSDDSDLDQLARDLVAHLASWPLASLGLAATSATPVINPANNSLVLVAWVERTPTCPVAPFRYSPRLAAYMPVTNRAFGGVSEDKEVGEPIELPEPQRLPYGYRDKSVRQQHVALKEALFFRFPHITKIERNPGKGVLNLSILRTSLRSLLIHKDWILDAAAECNIPLAEPRAWNVRKYRRDGEVHYLVAIAIEVSSDRPVNNRFLLEEERKRVQKDRLTLEDEISALATDPHFLKQARIKTLRSRAQYLHEVDTIKTERRGRPRKEISGEQFLRAYSPPTRGRPTNLKLTLNNPVDQPLVTA